MAQLPKDIEQPPPPPSVGTVEPQHVPLPQQHVDAEEASPSETLPFSRADKGKGVDRSDQSDSLGEQVASLSLEPFPPEHVAVAPSPSPPGQAQPEPLQSPVAKEEVEEEWPLKTIPWPPLPPPPSQADERNGLLKAEGLHVQIISQNHNGPCSLIALCNVLILRGDIAVHPPSRQSVTFSYLSALLADFLIRSNDSGNETTDSLSAVLSVLPSTRYGLNLNPRFASIDGFRPSADPTTATGELALFELAKVPLLHGWVVDPQDEDAWDIMVEKCGDYDSAMESIVAGDVVSGNEVTDGTEEQMLQAVEKRSQWTPEEEEKVRIAHFVRKFLDATRTQLTYHGLFLLSTHLQPSSLSAMFRNNHLAVLFRRPTLPGSSTGPQLFTLVTDSTFSTEPNVVWESLEDVDGSSSEFYDGILRMSHVRGGDWVGRDRRTSAPPPREEPSRPAQQHDQVSGDQAGLPEDADFALAQQLQHEEDDFTRQQQELEQRERQDRRERRRQAEQTASPPQSTASVYAPGARPPPKKEKKKDKDCLIM